MKNILFFVLCLLILIPKSMCAEGISNGYGTFFVIEETDDYEVMFVLYDIENEFSKVQAVSMMDCLDNGEGDVTVLVYRNGDKQVFLRSEEAYQYFVSHESKADVCDGWSPRIKYRTETKSWRCSQLNFFVRYFMWYQIDNGLENAKKQEWVDLSTRIKKSVASFIK